LKACCFSGKQQVKACEQSFISACVADVLSSDGGFFFGRVAVMMNFVCYGVTAVAELQLSAH
jgi:hypothetical protein